MRKVILPIILFLTVFILAYLTVCFLIPGFRIKLEAEPMAYFMESIRHMAPIKCAFAALAGGIAAAIPFMVHGKQKN